MHILSTRVNKLYEMLSRGGSTDGISVQARGAVITELRRACFRVGIARHDVDVLLRSLARGYEGRDWTAVLRCLGPQPSAARLVARCFPTFLRLGIVHQPGMARPISEGAAASF